MLAGEVWVDVDLSAWVAETPVADPLQHSPDCTPELRAEDMYAGDCARCEQANQIIDRLVRGR